MDKYHRRALRKWEAKKAKDQLKLEEFTRLHSYQQAQATIDEAVEAYEPAPNAVFVQARALCSDPYISTWNVNELLPLHWDGRWELMTSRRVRVFVSPLEIAAEIAERNHAKEQQYVWRLAHTLLCHRARANRIRDELLAKTTRFRAIYACRHGFKEELMMAVWHPRRVEKFLNTYGWEAYENLLGG